MTVFSATSFVLKWCALTPSFPIWARTSSHGPGMSLKKLTKPGTRVGLFANCYVSVCLAVLTQNYRFFLISYITTADKVRDISIIQINWNSTLKHYFVTSMLTLIYWKQKKQKKQALMTIINTKNSPNKQTNNNNNRTNKNKWRNCCSLGGGGYSVVAAMKPFLVMYFSNCELK